MYNNDVSTLLMANAIIDRYDVKRKLYFNRSIFICLSKSYGADTTKIVAKDAVTIDAKIAT